MEGKQTEENTATRKNLQSCSYVLGEIKKLEKKIFRKKGTTFSR